MARILSHLLYVMLRKKEVRLVDKYNFYKIM